MEFVSVVARMDGTAGGFVARMVEDRENEVLLSDKTGREFAVPHGAIIRMTSVPPMVARKAGFKVGGRN